MLLACRMSDQVNPDGHMSTWKSCTACVLQLFQKPSQPSWISWQLTMQASSLLRVLAGKHLLL